MARVRALGSGEGDRAAGLALTIQTVANQQPAALREQQRGVADISSTPVAV